MQAGKLSLHPQMLVTGVITTLQRTSKHCGLGLYKQKKTPVKTSGPQANELPLLFVNGDVGQGCWRKAGWVWSCLVSWVAGVIFSHSSVKHSLRFQCLFYHIHCRVCVIRFYFYCHCHCCFVTRRAAVVSSMLHLCRPCESLLYEVRRQEKDTFETKTK